MNYLTKHKLNDIKHFQGCFIIIQQTFTSVLQRVCNMSKKKLYNFLRSYLELYNK